MSLKTFWQQYRLYLTPFLFLCLGGAWIYFVVLPIRRQTHELKDNLQKFALEGEILDRQSRRLDELRLQTERIDRDRDRLQVVIRRDRLVELIEIFERLAQDTHNTFTIEQGSASNQTQPAKRTLKAAPKGANTETADTAAPVEKQSQETILGTLPSDKFVEVTLKLAGDYTGLFRFLKRVEVLSYYVDVAALSITPFEADQSKTARDDALPVAGENGIIPIAPAPASVDPSWLMTLQVVVYVLD